MRNVVKTFKTAVSATILLFITAGAANAGLIASSTFDTGFDGWTDNPGNNPATFTWQNAGGNPGGYIKFDNNFGPIVNARISAPGNFLGNWSALGVDRIAYDAAIFRTGNFVGSAGPYRLHISGPGGAATFSGPNPGNNPPPDWVTIDALVDESVWLVTSGTWNALMSDISEFQISMAYYTNLSSFEITGVDNVFLFDGTSQVPEPTTLLLLGVGLAGLGFARKRLH